MSGGLGWSGDDYGKFTSAYGWFNVFLLMLIFGGMILDKMGVRFTGLMATGIMLVGVFIKWFGISHDFGGETVSIFGTEWGYPSTHSLFRLCTLWRRHRDCRYNRIENHCQMV